MTKRNASRSSKPAHRPLPSPTLVYLALHENKLALCIAAGLITPWPKGAAIPDHHVAARRLVWEPGRLSASARKAATGDLTYGSVVLVEVDLGQLKDVAADPACVTAVPLTCVTRVLFPSEDTLLQFVARASAYADVPPKLVPMVSEPLRFLSDDTDTVSPTEPQPSLESGSPECKPAITEGDLARLDRDAGAIATILWTLGSLGRPELLVSAAGLISQLQSPESPTPIPVALAVLVDSRPEPGLALEAVYEATRALAALSPTDGLDPRKLLRDTRTAVEGLHGKIPETLDRFFGHSDAILAGSRDLPASAFSDDEGSIKLRGLLLFLLNPEAGRIESIRRRSGSVGDRVYLLAAALTGFHCGFSSLEARLKGHAPVACAIPQLTLEVFLRRAPEFTVQQWWLPEDGRHSTTLSWRDIPLVETIAARHQALGELADASKSLGLPARFDRNTGELHIGPRQAESTPVTSARVCDVLPVFPRTNGIELVREQQERLTKKVASAQVADVNTKSATTGIFASGLFVSPKVSRVCLHAFLENATGPAALSDALTSLDNAYRSAGPEKHSDAVEAELPLKFERSE